MCFFRNSYGNTSNLNEQIISTDEALRILKDYPYGLVFKYENDNKPLDEIQTSCEINNKEYTLTFHKDYFASINYYEILENININISAMFDVDFCLTFK